jgi:hypothetical protein
MRIKWKKGDVYDKGTMVCQLKGESLFVVKHNCESNHFGIYLGNLNDIPELKANILEFAKSLESCFKDFKYGIKTKDIDYILERAKSDLRRLDSFKVWTPKE